MNLRPGSIEIQYSRLACVLALLSVALCGTRARTQEVTAGVTGTITDPDGAVVVGAVVPLWIATEARRSPQEAMPRASITCNEFLWELINFARRATVSARRPCRRSR